jgi:hypothetical protein
MLFLSDSLSGDNALSLKQHAAGLMHTKIQLTTSHTSRETDSHSMLRIL